MSTVVVGMVMERRERVFQVNPQGSSTRRNLFGPVNHEQQSRMLQRELARISREDSKRWNFNFQEEKPLTGRYEWTPVVVTPTTTPPTTTPSTTTTSTDTSSTAKKQTSITDFMRQRKRLASSTTKPDSKKTKTSSS